MTVQKRVAQRRVVEVKPLTNTPSGNPRWSVTYDDDDHDWTVPDGDVGYKLISKRFHEGAFDAFVTYDEFSRITDMELLKHGEEEGGEEASAEVPA